MRGLRPKLDWNWFFGWLKASLVKAIMVHAAFRFPWPNYGMSKIRAPALLFCLLGLVASGAGSSARAQGLPARAQGLRAEPVRFGGWGYYGVPWLGVPQFVGPRYYGPYPYAVEGPSTAGERFVAPAGPPPGPKKCYSAAETRERVASQKLRPAFEMMRKASTLTGAEAIAGKLCHWNDDDIYVISLLRHNGALVRVFMNAVTGRVIGARNLH